MTAFDAIKTAFIIDNPDIENNEDLETYLLEKFNISSIEDIDDLSGSDKIKLKQEERIARAKLDGIFGELNKTEIENKDKEELQQKKTEMFKKAWSNVVDTAKSNIKEISIPTLDNGKEKSYMSYALKDADPYFSEMLDVLSSGGKELTEDNLKEGLAYMEARYFLDHKAEIISSIIEHERSSVIEEYEKKYANVVPLGNPVEKGSDGKESNAKLDDYIKSLGL